MKCNRSGRGPSGAFPDPPSRLARRATVDLPKLSPESHAEVEARVQTILSQYGPLQRYAKADAAPALPSAQPPLDRCAPYGSKTGDGPALYLNLVEREKNPSRIPA